MNEPSILDYVKSIFKNFGTFKDFVRSIFERRDTTQLVETPVPQAETRVESPPAVEKGPFPWLVTLVLLLALVGQRFFEPPRQFYHAGIVLYLCAFGILLLAFRR